MMRATHYIHSMKRNRHRAQLDWLTRFYVRVNNGGLCVYCGEQADQEDHFVPLSKAALCNAGFFLVPACWECNNIARDKIFNNIDDKMQFIHSIIIERTEKYVEEEDRCQNIEERKFKTRRRISWRNRDNPAYVYLAEIHTDRHDYGRNSVRVDAEQPIISRSDSRPSMRGVLLPKVAEDKQVLAWNYLKEMNRGKFTKENQIFLVNTIRKYGVTRAIEIFKEMRF